MKIAVVSDTHIGQRVPRLPQSVWDEISVCDGIVHCGDFTTFSAYEMLKELGKPFWAIHGNMDEPQIVSILPSTTRFSIDKLDIFVCHGWGGPSGLERRILEYIHRENLRPPDIVLFGHSHLPFEGELQGIQFFNPGSASGNLFSAKGSLGILEVVGQEIKWQLRKISTR